MLANRTECILFYVSEVPLHFSILSLALCWLYSFIKLTTGLQPNHRFCKIILAEKIFQPVFRYTINNNIVSL